GICQESRALHADADHAEADPVARRHGGQVHEMARQRPDDERCAGRRRTRAQELTTRPIVALPFHGVSLSRGRSIMQALPVAPFRSPVNDTVVRWEEHATFNPAAVVKDGKVHVLYRAEDASGDPQIGHHTSRIGLAESADGLRFTRRRAPVLYPDRDAQAPYEWPGGVEDPRVVESADGTYVLTYTQWNRRIPRLAVATSRDLIHWTKRGP